MDLIKIGKFMAECRKNKKLTQEELSEKLSVTDRAVSKWERGLSLPDSGKMLDLCNILGISVNELLIGEKSDIKDYDKKTNELLLEMTQQEESNNRRMMKDMWVLLISSFVFYMGIVYISSIAFEEGPLLTTIVVVSTIIFVIVGLYALRLEVQAGYYECNNCHNKFKPQYLSALIAPHVHTTRYLKCPNCGKRTWSKKVLTK